jgi:ADP-ribose pyrophosphatase YjhB (NUDIX family)
MRFCPSCGQSVSLSVPEGDHLPRYICTSCAIIHYENPRLIVGCIPEYEGKILLCRRAIEPRRGFWTAPAGFMENGETLQMGAARESMEEALAQVEIGSIVSIVHVLQANQVHVMFRAKLLDKNVGAGPESLEVELFDEADIPWDGMAFRSIEFALKRYLEDRAAGQERLHFHDMEQRRAPRTGPLAVQKLQRVWSYKAKTAATRTWVAYFRLALYGCFGRIRAPLSRIHLTSLEPIDDLCRH